MAATADGRTESGFAGMRAQGSTDRVEELVPEYEKMVQGLRRVFQSGKTKDLKWREQQLTRIQELIEDRHEQITASVRADLGGPKVRGLGEVGAHTSAAIALKSLREWAAPEKATTPFEVSPTRLGKSYVRKEPKGVALIIVPWNYPFELTLQPLVSAISAGCCVVVKPSEVSRASAKCIEECVTEYLDPECVRVVQGAVAETQALLRVRWDHIFYTGSGDIGRKVMAAAAAHLTPVTLELGGKSPTFVDGSARLQVAIDRVGAAKWFNAGQTCIAPDYVLVDNKVKGQFIDGLRRNVEKHYGQDPRRSADWGRIISENHARRVLRLIESAKGEVAFGGPAGASAEERYVPPTVIDMRPGQDDILRQEIFGPVLPVIGVDNIDDAIAAANGVCDRPLALYVFAEDRKVVDKVLDGTLSGGCCVNTAIEHVMNPHLPFGGVGASGIGAYHGRAGFDEFTHRRACLEQDSLIKRDAALPPPPYTDRVYDILIKVAVTGFLSRAQRRVLRPVLKLAAALVALAALRRFLRG